MRTLVRKFIRVVPYAAPEWPSLLAIVLLTLAYSGLAALQPWPLKILVDYGLSGVPPGSLVARIAALTGLAGPPAYIALAALASIAVFLFSTALDAFMTWAWTVGGQRMVYALAGDLFLRLQRLSLLFHSRRSVGDSLSRITGDAWSIYTVTDGLLVAPVRSVVMFVSVGLVAWQLDRDLTLLMVGVVPLLVGSAMYFGAYLKRTALINREAIARLTSFVHQCLGSMPVVQVFSGEARNALQFACLAQEAVSARQKGALANNVYGTINGAVTTIGVAVIAYSGAMRVLHSDMSLGTLLVFVAYVGTLETAARSLFGTYGSLRTVEASIDRVLEVLDSAESVHEAADALPLPPHGPRSGRLTLERVTFGYERSSPVLRELSLDISPGETIALVGSTGAGKTTLASLVPRFFDPWEGRVLLDGIDLRHVSLASLRAEVALVLQEPFILPISVADNIAYGRPEATREEIVAAAVAANAHEFISSLHQGYDTVLGEQGATLSGGQQQRISIARALLKNARVLVLDEPTASLDIASEQVIMEALQRLMAGRTTLIIAHRLSTVRRAHRIAVLEGGRIAELGTHDELMLRAGKYARFQALHEVTGGEALQ